VPIAAAQSNVLGSSMAPHRNCALWLGMSKLSPPLDRSSSLSTRPIFVSVSPPEGSV